jgi:hypothetical protein
MRRIQRKLFPIISPFQNWAVWNDCMGEVLTSADFTGLRAFLVARNVQRLPTVVRLRVALRAERDQILFRILAGVAAKPFVVNFQIRHRATRLAPAAIPT